MVPLSMKLTSFILLFALVLTPPLSAETTVTMFPPDAIELNDNYRDWYGPVLEDLAEKPLWPGKEASQRKEVIRFTFIPGAMRVVGRHATVIRIDVEGGDARLVARTQINQHRKRVTRKVSDKRLSSAEVRKLQALAEQAEPWPFPVSTWEKDEGGTISIHCKELTMERRQPSGYAVSHVLISCTQPDRLMPLVNYVAELVGQRRKDLRY